jgi:NTE family protein
MGAYWGIDTDPAKVNPTGALPCDPAKARALAHLGTRLSDLGEQASKQLINWGYAICDRSTRINYKGAMPQCPTNWPYPEARLGWRCGRNGTIWPAVRHWDRETLLSGDADRA